MKLGFIGVGQVGGTLARRLGGKDHSIYLASRHKDDAKTVALATEIGPHAKVLSLQETVDGSDIIFLATPWSENKTILSGLQRLDGKILIDCTNPLKPDLSGLVTPDSTSGAETIQSLLPRTKVVKALNTVGYNVMANPEFKGGRALMYYCGNDAEAKTFVQQLLLELGFEPIDAGALLHARLLEPLALLWITSAYKFGLGREHALGLLRRTT